VTNVTNLFYPSRHLNFSGGLQQSRQISIGMRMCDRIIHIAPSRPSAIASTFGLAADMVVNFPFAQCASPAAAPVSVLSLT
jgi:hypothetical protein